MKALNKPGLLFILMTGLLTLSWSCTQSLLDEEDPTLPDNYAYTVSLKCFCYPVGPFDIEIRNAEIVSFESSEFDVAELSDESKESFTIDNLHIRLLNFLAEDPFTSEVINHPIYGFPMDVFIDPVENIADEEWGYEITDFKVL